MSDIRDVLCSASKYMHTFTYPLSFVFRVSPMSSSQVRSSDAYVLFYELANSSRLWSSLVSGLKKDSGINMGLNTGLDLRLNLSNSCALSHNMRLFLRLHLPRTWFQTALNKLWYKSFLILYSTGCRLPLLKGWGWKHSLYEERKQLEHYLSQWAGPSVCVCVSEDGCQRTMHCVPGALCSSTVTHRDCIVTLIYSGILMFFILRLWIWLWVTTVRSHPKSFS